MEIINHPAGKKIKYFYLGAAVFLLSFFILLIFQPAASIFHEEDLWWLLPTISYLSEGGSFLQTLKTHLFDPFPTNRGEPSMNLYLYFILSFFGFQAGYFIFTSLFIHFCCAALLYFLARKIGLEFRAAFFTALSYAAMFIHFDYYIYTMGSQHLAAIFFTLLVLNLYLDTTKRIDYNERWKPYFWLTLFANFLASFCQIAILILPASILAHILICSKNGEDRVRKYDIWMPLFIMYFGYILIRSFYYGYPHLESYLHLKEHAINVYSAAFFPAIFAFAVGGLFLFRLALKLYDRFKLRKALNIIAGSAVFLYLSAFLAVYGNERLLIGMPRGRIPLFELMHPYNLMRPLVGMFTGFFEPLKMALSIDSAKARNYIPLQSDLIFILLAVFFASFFCKKLFAKHKGAVVLLIPYLFALRNMTEFFLWDNHGTVPSRYFIYITPLFSVIFCSVFVYLYFFVTGKTRMKNTAKDIVLVLLFIGLCVPNIIAIKFDMFKNRLLNTRYIYDYIRASELIKDDLSPDSRAKRIGPADIYIDGVSRMPFKEADYDFSPVSPESFDNFRYVFAQALGDKAMLDINVNRSPGESGKGIVYKIENADIKDALNINIDVFSRDLDEAVKGLNLKNYGKAGVLFQKALEKRPFLFRYILAGYGPEDLAWITNGRSARKWVYDMTNHYLTVHPQEKIVLLSKILNTEIDGYIESLFCASYFRHLEGDDRESASLFSQIYFLDADPESVFLSLKDRLDFNPKAEMLAFFNEARVRADFNEPVLRGGPFSRIVAGLLVNKDVFK